MQRLSYPEPGRQAPGRADTVRRLRPYGRNTRISYSQALLTDIIWDEATINRLFAEDDIVTPGTKMPIQRMKNPDRRASNLRENSYKETIVE